MESYGVVFTIDKVKISYSGDARPNIGLENLA